MLQDRRVHAVLPSQDLDAAKSFWERTVGLAPTEVDPGTTLYRVGEGTAFAVSRSMGKSSGSFTQMSFTVTDVGSEVRELQARGVAFEEYDYPTLRTVNGVADMPGVGRAAWFKDPDGNLIGLIQFG